MSREVLQGLADKIKSSMEGQSFGIVKFWGFGVIPPNDQSYLLTEVRVEENGLSLVFMHESGMGNPGIISVEAPDGLEPAALGRGIAIRHAQAVRLDEHEAVRDGEQFKLKTPRGEGLWPLKAEPALILTR